MDLESFCVNRRFICQLRSSEHLFWVCRISVIMLFDMGLCGLERVINGCCGFCRELIIRDPILC